MLTRWKPANGPHRPDRVLAGIYYSAILVVWLGLVVGLWLRVVQERRKEKDQAADRKPSDQKPKQEHPHDGVTG